MFEYMIWMLIAHFFGDFVFQSHWMASNKSKSNYALSLHVLIYSCIITIPTLCFLTLPMVALFFVVMFVTHFATDYVTSRISSKLWAKQDWHNFFVVIGFDQLVHYVTIIITVMALL